MSVRLGFLPWKHTSDFIPTREHTLMLSNSATRLHSNSGRATLRSQRCAVKMATNDGEGGRIMIHKLLQLQHIGQQKTKPAGF